MIGAGGFRREQQENQVNRLIVECLEIDWLMKPRKHAKQTPQFRQLAVRNCNAIANRGRAELFALKQDLQDSLLVLPGEFGSARGQFLNRLLLVVNLESRNYRFRDRKSTRLNSSHLGISYAVFCLKK